MAQMTWDSSSEAAALLVILWTRARNVKNKLRQQEWATVISQVLEVYRGDVRTQSDDKIREKIRRKIGEVSEGLGCLKAHVYGV